MLQEDTQTKFVLEMWGSRLVLVFWETIKYKITIQVAIFYVIQKFKRYNISYKVLNKD